MLLISVCFVFAVVFFSPIVRTHDPGLASGGLFAVHRSQRAMGTPRGVEANVNAAGQ